MSSFCRLLPYRVVGASACSDAFGGTRPLTVEAVRSGLSANSPLTPRSRSSPPNEFLIGYAASGRGRVPAGHLDAVARAG
jgi:hypothetical protein